MRDFVTSQECLAATRYCLCSKASKSNKKEVLYNTYVNTMNSLKRVPGYPGYYIGSAEAVATIRTLCDFQLELDKQNKKVHITATYEEELCM